MLRQEVSAGGYNAGDAAGVAFQRQYFRLGVDVHTEPARHFCQRVHKFSGRDVRV